MKERNEMIDMIKEACELRQAIKDAGDSMRLVLDDDWCDAIEMEVMAIADAFGINDTEWVRKQIEKNV